MRKGFNECGVTSVTSIVEESVSTSAVSSSLKSSSRELEELKHELQQTNALQGCSDSVTADTWQFCTFSRFGFGCKSDLKAGLGIIAMQVGATRLRHPHAAAICIEVAKRSAGLAWCNHTQLTHYPASIRLEATVKAQQVRSFTVWKRHNSDESTLLSWWLCFLFHELSLQLWVSNDPIQGGLWTWARAPKVHGESWLSHGSFVD